MTNQGIEPPPTTSNPPFRVRVVYVIPAMDELRRRFPAYVNPAFDGITFKPIKVCEGVSRETRKIEPKYVHLDYSASSEEVLAEIDKRGFRPCLPEELIAFGDAYPEEQQKFCIVALGSEANVGGGCRVAFLFLWDDGDGRSLGLDSVDGVWDDDCRFLVVRKDPSKSSDGVTKEYRDSAMEGAVQGDEPSNNDALPADHYRVHIAYAPLPSMDELKKKFGKNHVSFIFDGRPWKLHPSCVGMDRTPGKKIFYLHDVGRDWGDDERPIAWGLEQRNQVAPNGYRPATPEETHEFNEAHPDELADYVGLGAFAMHGYRRYAAGVWRVGDRRIFGSRGFGRRWGRGTRILFVSKTG